LTASNYNMLTQCETLDDIKLQLGPAYGDFLSNLPPNPSTSAITSRMQDKFVSEFRYIRANAVGAMAEFMDYITYAYMIDNVALLITGTLHERDTKELLDRCHPLGWFETLPVLCAATTVEELYNSVLIESPLEPYFKKGLSHQDLDELNIEIVRNTLFKAYLEDFHQWVNSHPAMSGSPTAEVMTELLEFEADRRAINITLNSFGTELSKQDRAHMYPDIGRLYPHGSQALARADDVEAVRAAVDSVPDFRSAFATVSLGGGSGPGNMEGGSSEGKSLDDLFYQQEMNIAKRAFTRQFTFALVFSWVRLKEQEIRNIIWIAECIAMKQKDRIGNYISVF
jgi:V-type H+-transporting ATPase subunit d